MVTIVLVAIAFVTVVEFAISSTTDSFSSLINNETAMIQHGNLAKIALLECRRNEKDTLYNDDESLVKKINEFAAKLQGEINNIASLAESSHDGELTDLANSLKKSADDYHRLFQAAVATPVGQQRLLATIPMRKAATETEKQLNAFLDGVNQKINEVQNKTLRYVAWVKASVFAFGLMTVGLGILFALSLVFLVVRPLRLLRDTTVSLADGQLDADVPLVGRGDEIGAMAKAIEVFKDNAREQRRLEESERRTSAIREERGKRIEGLALEFDRTVALALGVVSTASAELEATAQSMSANAEFTNKQAFSVAEASGRASSSVHTVTNSAEQLSASIGEISRQVDKSSRISQVATEEAARTNSRVQGLAESSARIGEVVNLINNIARQTNLLALNATIEAARAGEAGKGFAVVANEVKNLANQTAKATDEIEAQIGAVQAATVETVAAIAGIAARIQEINQIGAAITSAVEEQSSATMEISLNVQQAASGTREVTSQIGSVTQAAAETGSASEQVLTSARSLSSEAGSLRELVGKFLNDVRAA